MIAKTKIYSIENIKEQAKELVQTGKISRQQKIYALCHFIPAPQWSFVEKELELNEFLLRDTIIDLIQPEKWDRNR